MHSASSLCSSFNVCLLSVLILLLNPAPADSVRISGSILKAPESTTKVVINSDFGWHYLGRFAFDNSGKARFNGVFDIGGGSAKVTGTKHFLIFYRDGDGFDGWPSVYNARMSCLNKVIFSRFQATLQIGASTVYDFTVKSATRAAYWYIAYAACDATLINITYDMRLTNDASMFPFTSEHISFDRQGVIEVFGFVFGAYFLLSLLFSRSIARLLRRGVLHPVHQIIIGCFFVQWLGLTLELAHETQIAVDGVGLPQTKNAGDIIGAIAYISFLFSLMMIARGWSITTSKLSRKAIMGAYYTLFLGAFIGVYAWDATRDKSATLYVFESWPGFAVLILNAFLLLNFWVLSFRSFVFEKRKPKKIFYRNFVVAYTCWYLQIPVAVIIANIARNYYRDSLVVTFLCICRFLGYACIPFVIKSSNTKSIEFFSSSALTDKRIPAANKAMRIAPISSELPSRAVGNILDVTAAARSLDRQPVTPSDRFRARANRPRCSSARCIPVRSHTRCSLRLPPARIVSSLAPAPRSGSVTQEQRVDYPPSPSASRVANQNRFDVGGSVEVPVRTSSSSVSSSRSAPLASAAPATTTSASSSVSYDAKPERTGSSSSGAAQAPFSRQGSDGTFHGSSAAPAPAAAARDSFDFDEESAATQAVSKSKGSRKKLDVDAPAAVETVPVAAVVASAAAAGDDFDDWDAADAPSAAAPATAEKKKKKKKKKEKSDVAVDGAPDVAETELPPLKIGGK